MSSIAHSESDVSELRITPFQQKCAEVIYKSRNNMASLGDIAWKLKSNNLAVYSAMWSLREKGLAGYIRSGDDQWAVQIWCLRGKLKEVCEHGKA